MTETNNELLEVTQEESVQEIAEEFETVFDLADVIRLHKGVCFGAFEDAILTYDLDIEHAAATFLPPLFREEIVDEFKKQQAELTVKEENQDG